MAIKNAKRPGNPDFPNAPINELGLYFIKSDAVNFDTTTGEVELFSLPSGTLIHEIGYTVLDAWVSSEASNPLIFIGSTANYRLYGELGSAQLTSTSPGVGLWPVNYESTGESKVVAMVASLGAIPVVPLTGSFEIWMSYRANSESQRWIQNT